MVTHTAFFLSTTLGFLCPLLWRQCAPWGLQCTRMGTADGWLKGSPTDPTQPPGACPDKENVRQRWHCLLHSLHTLSKLLAPVGHGISWLDVPPIRSLLEARASLSCPPIFFLFSEIKGMYPPLNEKRVDHPIERKKRNKRHACCYPMIPFIYASQICWQLQKRKGRRCSGCYWRCTVCLLTADKYGSEKKRLFDYHVVHGDEDDINIRPDVETAYPIIDALISF